MCGKKKKTKIKYFLSNYNDKNDLWLLELPFFLFVHTSCLQVLIQIINTLIMNNYLVRV